MVEGRQRVWGDDETTIRDPRNSCNRTLDLAGVTHASRNQLHSQGRRHRLDRGERTNSAWDRGHTKPRRSPHPWHDLLQQFQPFTLMPYSKSVKPVALPPGRAKVSTTPAPTGSMTPMNTMGTLLVSCCNGKAATALSARIMSGASATSSAACLRIVSELPPPQRVVIPILLPSIQSSC